LLGAVPGGGPFEENGPAFRGDVVVAARRAGDGGLDTAGEIGPFFEGAQGRVEGTVVHGERAAGPLFEVLSDLVAVHGPAGAGQHPEHDEGPGAGVELLLEFAIGGFRIHGKSFRGWDADRIWLIPGGNIDE
jgi:hypothetical protein